MFARSSAWISMAVVSGLLSACAPGARPTLPFRPAGAPAQAPTPEDLAQSKALFGDLHIHTSWSFDAFVFKTTSTPDDAYRFAKGAPLQHPSGGTYQLDRPLDFVAVTDHSEFLGVMSGMRDPESALSRTPVAAGALDPDPNVVAKVFLKIVRALRTRDLSVFAGAEDQVRAVPGETWERIIESANRNNEPGKFTALIGYEWSASPNGRNLHRNVIFRGDKAPPPFSSIDSDRPEDLWKYLDRIRREGFAVLAIPHNSNLSDGAMFARVDSDGKPIDAAYAAARSRNEPVVEITQTKGTSETHPMLSPNDEFADHELIETYVGSDKPVTQFAGGYVRDALKTGLAMQDGEGFNPFRLGIIGSTDTHIGMSPILENRYSGKVGVLDGTPAVRLDCTFCAGNMELRKFSASGLAVVWARENTRAAIFDALARRETYATTGPRMQVRVFAGYGMAGIRPGAEGWVLRGYRQGVPMGGALAPSNGRAPSFAVWAVKDVAGANLDRIQIIKVWSRGGVTGEKIYDVALSGGRRVDPRTGKAPAVGNTVNVAAATYANTIGAGALTATWTDPDFKPGDQAAYYVRVLEIPTPRWSTFDARTLGRPAPAGLPASIQERAFTSPIWYDGRAAG